MDPMGRWFQTQSIIEVKNPSYINNQERLSNQQCGYEGLLNDLTARLAFVN
ncbi:hypothetical protein M569_17639 [Genlisea aurea]|uniref:Uncharacterized protein n=1 Tax=Genlisea aurea TaxID=192259 RepID=S8DCU4_9LAMI|nr:hypothetical protein M569_17639 [Genlisea aurea]